MTSANRYCTALMELALRHNVKSVVCSPGSRNAPLLIAAHCSGLRTRVVVDERTAAFVALGEATVSRRPVMVVCTSGTALLNYAPAVAEAYHAGVPLIVVSADRPVEWIDQDDSQTMRQYEALAHFVKRSFDIPVYQDPDTDRGRSLMWFVNRQVNEAMLTALSPKQGPVHVNIQLDQPLGSLARLPREFSQRFISAMYPKGDLHPTQLDRLAMFAANRRILILAGHMPPDHLMYKAVAEMARLPNVWVAAENLSNLSGREARQWGCVDSLLCMLDSNTRCAMAPDVVISLGGALVSRMMKEFLRSNPPQEHWSLGWANSLADPLKSLTLRIETSPERVLKPLAAVIGKYQRKQTPDPGVSAWARLWKQWAGKAAARLSEYAGSAPWSDFQAFSHIAAAVPPDANVCLSNGTAVRYAQLFHIDCHAEYCNRGVSGIDGCTSTAIGCALAYNPDSDAVGQRALGPRKQTLLITGDMSFAYDSGALGCGLLPDCMKIIVLANGGGGIFRFIGSTSSLPPEILDPYFCADPKPPVEALAAAYDMGYRKVSDLRSLKPSLTWLFDTPHAAILEVETDPETSASVLTRFLRPENK